MGPSDSVKTVYCVENDEKDRFHLCVDASWAERACVDAGFGGRALGVMRAHEFPETHRNLE